MINWIKDKWQENIFHKIWIFAMIWILIFLALWFVFDCVGAIAYTHDITIFILLDLNDSKIYQQYE
ncbi:hypothetical protein SIXOD_v1c28780 (plasmid) [Spiroplasma ixodetis Y32]|nr:hypothetical protein SIXOD_v1c28780 [Spiroplasma ixodetis Y32]